MVSATHMVVPSDQRPSSACRSNSLAVSRAPLASVWVADSTDDKLYAYALSGGARQAGRDFNTLPGTGGFGANRSPWGLTSDGATMWVRDYEAGGGNKIYSFNMPPSAPASTDATLSGLALSDGTLRPEFAADTTEYRAAVANGVSQVTVTPTPNDAGATVTYLDGSDAALADADDNTGGQQVNAAVGLTTFKVKVTAADGNTSPSRPTPWSSSGTPPTPTAGRPPATSTAPPVE